MATFTSSLPDELLQRLAEESEKLKVPKNRIIEKALTLFLDELKKVRYVNSYKRAAADENIMMIAEEGMLEYFKDLEDFDKS